MKTKSLRIAVAICALLALPSCITTQLAYINEDIGGHAVSASVTLSGKEPVVTIAATKRGIPAGKGK